MCCAVQYGHPSFISLRRPIRHISLHFCLHRQIEISSNNAIGYLSWMQALKHRISWQGALSYTHSLVSRSYSFDIHPDLPTVRISCRSPENSAHSLAAFPTFVCFADVMLFLAVPPPLVDADTVSCGCLLRDGHRILNSLVFRSCGLTVH
jgi:hypothetical protein